MWKYLVMILALAGAIFAIGLARRSIAAQPIPPLATEPVKNPYPVGIAGAGLVEPASESIVIGVPEAGLVEEVYVKEGDVVKAGDKLLVLDTRALHNELVTARAVVLTAEADLQRVQAFRRKEEEPLLRARR